MKKYVLTLIVAAIALTAPAQQLRTKTLINAALHGWAYEIKGGFNIGGTAPISLPREIRSTDAYSPNLTMSIEGRAAKWFGADRRWGIIFGLGLENKGMTTKATVKNYSTEIRGDDGGKVKGRWTGGVRTKVRNSYLTIPVLAACKLSQRVNLSAGAYVSYLINGEFCGDVYDGYLREGDPTGDKIVYTDGAKSTYDFSDDLRRMNYGLRAGIDWKAFRHLKIYGDMTWGVHNIFHSSFNTITFKMYPIYLNIGFGYFF